MFVFDLLCPAVCLPAWQEVYACGNPSPDYHCPVSPRQNSKSSSESPPPVFITVFQVPRTESVYSSVKIRVWISVMHHPVISRLGCTHSFIWVQLDFFSTDECIFITPPNLPTSSLFFLSFISLQKDIVTESHMYVPSGRIWGMFTSGAP